MSIATCCVTGFQWAGTPSGGDNSNYPNVRLLADHYAREVDAIVFVPDFFDGEELPFEPVDKGRWQEVDIGGFMQRHGRDTSEPFIFECACALRKQYKIVEAVGFCYNGWAAFRLGAKEHGKPLLDRITVGHPSLLTKKDINEVAVPIQILDPELDPVYTVDLKTYTSQTLQQLNVSFDYQYFPGVEHACLVRGDPGKPGEHEAMIRGKNAAVNWLQQFCRRP
ncbi:dienelactone hydrolase family protein [Microthyrium microscopicum]|uniref:Dienelactone hydrolase family protein n=1 Tax=Microthyrium microscopicum TaxID=703497 RepID=A0A6A6U2U1_9PEZI|nr:dienelactone hydrolase family protein [Microthyrium microscopicum]